jgi:hypothetical protein
MMLKELICWLRIHIGRGRQVIAVCKSADALLMVRFPIGCMWLAAVLSLRSLQLHHAQHVLTASCSTSQVLDASKPTGHKEILTRELESVGIRLNRSPPNIFFKCAVLLHCTRSLLPCVCSLLPWQYADRGNRLRTCA